MIESNAPKDAENKTDIVKNLINARIKVNVMGNTAQRQPEPKSVTYKKELQPNICCKICNNSFEKGDIIYYFRQQYCHRECLRVKAFLLAAAARTQGAQGSGESTAESKKN